MDEKNSGTRGQGIDPTDFHRDDYTQFQSWLGETKSVEGCPVNCTYCFFKLDGQTPMRPRIQMTPEDTIASLGDTPTYQPETPINFGSQTDVFSTRETMAHYSEILRAYGDSEYPNPVVFITKRHIPEEFMDLANSVPQKVLFYISYSGLNGTKLEPTVNERHQRENFLNLKANGLPSVHYWRPFLPQNSSPDRMAEMLDFVAQNATCSVVNGLRLNSGIRDNIAPFWPEIMAQDYDFHTTGEFWPMGVRGQLQELSRTRYPEYPVFFGNTPCSVAYALDIPDMQGFHNGRMCMDSTCPLHQRGRCNDAEQIPTMDMIAPAMEKMSIDLSRVRVEEGRIIIRGKVDAGQLVYLKIALKMHIINEVTTYSTGHNWSNATDEFPIIEIPWDKDAIITDPY